MQLRRSASLKRAGGRVTPESSVNEVGINCTIQNQLLLEIQGERGGGGEGGVGMIATGLTC